MDVESDPEAEGHELEDEEDQPDLEPVTNRWPTPEWNAVNH
jgi:hypothetical protein